MSGESFYWLLGSCLCGGMLMGNFVGTQFGETHSYVGIVVGLFVGLATAFKQWHEFNFEDND